MIMKEVHRMKRHFSWTLEGLLVDKNGDGVIDGLSLFIDLPAELMPPGLIDFLARAGLETTALSLDFFERAGQQWAMEFQQSAVTLCEVENNTIRLFYQDVEELSSLLSEMATSGDSAVDPPEHAFIRSLADIWSGSGFGEVEEASPERHLDLNISWEDEIASARLFKELCLFAARCGLYSTSLGLPLTENPHAATQLTVKAGRDASVQLREENHVEVIGSRTELAAMLHVLNGQRHWTANGTFGFWEQSEKMAERQDEVWYEKAWEDISEVELAQQELAGIEGQTFDAVDVYLSEPLHVRTALANEWQARYPQFGRITVRSAFKPAFHWFREELLPNLPDGVQEIRIAAREENSAGGMELPIRWIQELYPIDVLVEKEVGIPKEKVVFSLLEDLPHTYEVEAILEDGTVLQIGSLEVPVTRLPYLQQAGSFVYPTTGAVRAYSSGSLAVDRHIPTDRERFYSFYMEEFVPELIGKLEGYKKGQGHDRPFFDRLEINIAMSEEEEKLGVDEERISSLEALYEDLYFNTLDVFADWGEKIEGVPFNAPGGIHPFMNVETGTAPKASITVYRWLDAEIPQVSTVQMNFENGRFTEAVVLRDGKAKTVPLHANLPPVPTAEGAPAAFSFQGRAIGVIEHFLPSGEQFDSALKLTLHKPTIVFEAGHHANEVSSSPAVVRLGEEGEAYLKHVNIVLIPFANPDGTALLQRMVATHPEWKHHAARYNAVGLEFAHVRYRNTVFGEADVLPHLMKKWAPDVIVDNHGIPSHEWVQPFAGYNSPPRFPVSYFLPSARLYGIGRLPEQSGDIGHAANLEALVSSISAQIEGTEIAAENRYWKERFRKYGNDWLPDVFPIEEGGLLHFYRYQTVTPEHPTVSILRYPEWVAADIISEAADEVVQGDVLEQCVEAQFLFNKGVLELLKEQVVQIERDGLSLVRQRPLRIY